MRRLAGEHLVQDGGERVDVAARVDEPVSRRLFRAHVLWRAERQAGLGEPRARRSGDGECDPEVRHHRLVVLEQDILGLDVAVDHAVAMRVVERRGDVGGEADGFVNRELPLPLEPTPQRFAFHVGHHVVDQAAGLAGIKQRQDMRVLQVGGDPDLTQEAIDPEHGGELGAQHLHGDVTVVLEIPGEVHGRHPTGAELTFNGVLLGEGSLETLPHVGHGVSKYGSGKRAAMRGALSPRNRAASPAP